MSGGGYVSLAKVDNLYPQLSVLQMNTEHKVKSFFFLFNLGLMVITLITRTYSNDFALDYKGEDD